MKTPQELLSTVTIVGLPKEYQKEEVINMLVMQNCYIKKFAVSNKIQDHMKIYAIRPLKNNPSCFQAFANVSSVLREGYKFFKDKVTIGLTSCKIYDRLDVKKRNKCQKFGRYAKDCPTQDVNICGKCTGNHRTSDCDSLVQKCANNMEDVHHQTTSYKCP